MLRPSKHAHPDQTIVAAATFTLRELQKKRVISYDDLKISLEKTIGGTSDVLFIPAVGLLHLLGLVDYQPTGDAFEYRGQS